MRHDLSLPTLGARLQQVDHMLIQVLAMRHRLALQVGAVKMANGNAPIYREQVEEDRIAAACDYGKLLGLKRMFVSSVMHTVIREACMDQIIQLQESPHGPARIESYEEQKSNLLRLTQRVAETFDSNYRTSHATRDYLDFEDRLLEEHWQGMDAAQRGTFLDLGCGTGSVSLRAANIFRSVVGIDLSEDMIEVATKKRVEKYANADVTFTRADLDDGIPLPDSSVSFVAMTLGTGSDLKNLEHVVDETFRVLERGGRFLFSFYNKDALIYRWPFLPWQVALPARINLDDDCLEVEAGGEIFQIYARAYLPGEVETLFARTDHRSIHTYPTISAVLPIEAFAGGTEGIAASVQQLDKQLAFGTSGAYIVVRGVKK